VKMHTWRTHAHLAVPQRNNVMAGPASIAPATTRALNLYVDDFAMLHGHHPHSPCRHLSSLPAPSLLITRKHSLAADVAFDSTRSTTHVDMHSSVVPCNPFGRATRNTHTHTHTR
jgi:hypothetical protein